MRNGLLLLLISAAIWGACQNDGHDAVQEIRGGPNSNMVRNPITADLPLDSNKLARIEYTESEFDFGEITEGAVVEHQFQFTNTGKVPLTILNARSSCGCTIPEWPHDPVPPGGTGFITAKFNSKGKHQEQRKLIYITANTYPNETKVMIKATIKPE